MEFCGGGSLMGMLNTVGHYRRGMLHKVMTQVVSGLSYLHDNRILHR